MNQATLVTAFLDLGRSEWSSPMFRRPNAQYFNAFSRLIGHDYPMVIYADDRHLGAINELIKANPGSCKKTIVPISESWLIDNLWTWSRLSRESEIMESSYYKSLIPQRIALEYPENVNPRYTILTHSKIDFLCHASESEHTKDQVLFWVDFGYLSDRAVSGGFSPKRRLSTANLVSDRINLCCLTDQITEQDFDPIHTLKHAPEKLTAGFFGGEVKALNEFRDVSHECLLKMQEMGIADDEQALWLTCLKTRPSLFAIHVFPGWHYGFRHFTED